MKIFKDSVNNAIITELRNVRAHSNADTIKLATVVGATVVVSLDACEGDLVVYFDANLSLSADYLKANNLYSSKELNSDTEVAGYFGKNGRVKAQKFRGEQSNGFTMPVESIADLCGVDVDILISGFEFQALNGIEVCRKYVPVVKESKNSKGKQAKVNYVTKMFPCHWDTEHLMRCLDTIPCGTVLLEEKIHGTSARSANALVEKKLGFFERLLIKLGFQIKTEEWKLLNGSRRVTLTKPSDKSRKFSEQVDARKEIFSQIKDNLKKGEQVYYEIAGYDKSGTFIQKGFPYGCKQGEYRAFLYRVTMTAYDGTVIDMPREYVYRRAVELGLEAPPKFISFMYNGDTEALVSIVQGFTDGCSTICSDTIREGVVVWFEGKDGWRCLKNKSYNFIELESKAKEQDDYIDADSE